MRRVIWKYIEARNFQSYKQLLPAVKELKLEKKIIDYCTIEKIDNQNKIDKYTKFVVNNDLKIPLNIYVTAGGIIIVPITFVSCSIVSFMTYNYDYDIFYLCGSILIYNFSRGIQRFTTNKYLKYKLNKLETDNKEIQKIKDVTINE